MHIKTKSKAPEMAALALVSMKISEFDIWEEKKIKYVCVTSSGNVQNLTIILFSANVLL